MPTIDRKHYIDMAKGIGILLVAYGHAVTSSCLLVPWACSFYMPLFFVCSGMCWKRSNSLKDCFVKLLIPYYIWGGIGELIGLAGSVLKRDFNLQAAVLKLIKYLFGMSMRNYPLWFLVAFFVAKIFFDLIMEKTKKEVFRIILITLLTFLGIGLGQVRQQYAFFFPYRLDIGFVMLTFLYIGYIVSRTGLFENQKTTICISAVSLIINLLSYKMNTLVSVSSSDYGFVPLFFTGAIAGSIFILSFCKLLERTQIIRAVLCFFGKNSMIIMCVHAIILYFVGVFCLHVLGLHDEYYQAVSFLICVAVLFVIIRMKNRYLFKASIILFGTGNQHSGSSGGEG